jgi:TPR repeat protein
MLYGAGRGVERDPIKAHLWLSLAVSGGYVGATQPLDAIASQMNEADLNRARQLARDRQAGGPKAATPN